MTQQELKALNVVATIDVNTEVVDNLGCTEFAAYDADEVDTVLAEKDKEIAELKDKLQNESRLLKETREWLLESQKLHKRCADNAIKVICHQKYKRCFKMAQLCEDRWADTATQYYKSVWYRKWQLRWLELAKKLKEAK